MNAQDSPRQINTSKPHPARVYDYLLGGKDHYLVDEEVARKIPAAAKNGAQDNRAFMRRAMAWVAETGVDQFLDIGTGIPTEPNLHQVVQKINPASRIVYTDNDPVVLRHAEALLVSTPEGATDYIEADVREPGVIIEHARAFLDFSRPVCLSLIALMHFISDDRDPYGIVRSLVGALPRGSFLVLSHGTLDHHISRELPPDEVERLMDAYRAHITLTHRTHAQVLRFFDGLELVDPPGLVATGQWHMDPAAPRQAPIGVFGGVARIP